MANKLFRYRVNLVPLEIENTERDVFRDALNAIPYLLYEVEQLNTGEKIVINKPGGKRNFGRLSRDDFMVFIYNPHEDSLWLISHTELLDDLNKKSEFEPSSIKKLLSALLFVCNGGEPEKALLTFQPSDCIGIPCETILKVYKWIWGQEDCNYPKGEGRWLSMNGILNHFGVEQNDLKGCNYASD